MDFVLYILPLGLVRHRTFRLSTWVSYVQTWAQMLTRTRGEDVSFTDVKIKIPGSRDVNDVMHRKRARRILGDLKKSVSWVLRSREEGWLSLARRGLVADATRVGGRGAYADGKASIERLCLSPYVEKPLNSKVKKSFVPELRSRKCFSCFGIPMFSVYMLWTFYVRFPYPYLAIVQRIFRYGRRRRWRNS